MSLHFSANQYTTAFDPKKLQNWQVPSEYRERPRAFDGFTQIVANNRGHLLPGVKRSRESPWGTFIGTYDMPLSIPGNTNPTARTGVAVERLLRSKTEGDIVLRGKLKKCKVPDPLPVKEDVKADEVLPPTYPQFEMIVNGADGSIARSGARNPEPLCTSPKIPPIGSRQGTPTLNWPKPQSAGSRRTPQLATTTNAAVAGSPAPELQGISHRTPINWPSPKCVTPEVLN